MSSLIKIEPRLHEVLGARRHCAVILAHRHLNERYKKARTSGRYETLGIPGHGDTPNIALLQGLVKQGARP
jgi:hypothetical protein